MPDRNLTFRIAAQDDSSTTFSKVAAASKREMGKVQKDLDDTASKGKQMAQVLESMADDLDDEFRKTEQAADRLGNALGPELAAKVNPEQIIGDFRRAGLTFEEIEADADELAAAIKHVDDVSERAGAGIKQSMGHASDGLDKVAHSGDQSRSVLANMAGNATSELPGIATALGPVNVAMGQLAEYAADGNIKLSSMISLAGGMVVLGAGTKLIADHMNRIAESNALHADRVEAFTQAILDGESAVGTLRDTLAETGSLDMGFGEGGTFDIAPNLDRLGLSLDQFNALARMSEDEIRAWAVELAGAGASASDVALVEAGLLSTHEDLATAEERAAVTTRLLGEATGASAEEMQAAREAADRYTTALEAVNDAEDAAFNNAISLEEATLNTADAFDAYTAIMGSSEASTRDQERAGLDLITAMDAQAQAAGRSAHDQAVASGNAAGAQAASTQAQIDSLFWLSLSLGAGSPLRNAINSHIAALQNIPTTINTTVRVNTAYGQGTVPIQSGYAPRASGGPVTAGQGYLVGEEGPELFMPRSSGTIVPAAATGATVSAGSPTVNIYATVNAGWGANGAQIADEIVDLLERWQSRNGALPLTVRT